MGKIGAPSQAELVVYDPDQPHIVVIRSEIQIFPALKTGETSGCAKLAEQFSRSVVVTTLQEGVDILENLKDQVGKCFKQK